MKKLSRFGVAVALLLVGSAAASLAAERPGRADRWRQAGTESLAGPQREALDASELRWRIREIERFLEHGSAASDEPVASRKGRREAVLEELSALRQAAQGLAADGQEIGALLHRLERLEGRIRLEAEPGESPRVRGVGAARVPERLAGPDADRDPERRRPRGEARRGEAREPGSGSELEARRWRHRTRAAGRGVGDLPVAAGRPGRRQPGSPERGGEEAIGLRARAAESEPGCQADRAAVLRDLARARRELLALLGEANRLLASKPARSSENPGAGSGDPGRRAELQRSIRDLEELDARMRRAMAESAEPGAGERVLEIRQRLQRLTSEPHLAGLVSKRQRDGLAGAPAGSPGPGGEPGAEVRAATGSIAGVVIDQATGSPLRYGEPYVQMDIFDSTGNYLTTEVVDCSGAYEVTGLAAGTYFASTWNFADLYDFNPEYLDELYDDIPCWNDCDVTTGDPITVTAGATSTADFALEKGGAISGTVTDAATGAPLFGFQVSIYDASGDWVRSARTNAAGVYHAGGLPSGSFFARARTRLDGYYLGELYNGLPCWDDYFGGCDVTAGLAIPVVQGVTTPAIDFALSRGGALSGDVLDAVTGATVNPGVSVLLYDASGSYVTQRWVYAPYGDGYVVPVLPAGTYYLATISNYDDELYDGFACEGGCTVTGGTAVVVAAGAQSTGVDFVLAAAGKGAIMGTVTDDLSGGGLERVYVDVFDAAGSQVSPSSLQTNQDGDFAFGVLPPGTYYARTRDTTDYDDELWNDLPCEPTCDPVTGTAITVAAGAASAADFGLSSPGRGAITGIVLSGDGFGTPLSGVQVTLYDSGGGWVEYVMTNAAGRFDFSGLSPGSYYLRTYSTPGFVGELYDSIQCLGWCDPTLGTAITVQAGLVEDLGIELVPGAGIAGSVSDAVSGLPLYDQRVAVFDAAGDYLGVNAYSDSSGNYRTATLPAGVYYLQTFNRNGYLGELYDDIPCWGGCSITSGNPVSVSAGADTVGIDFALDQGGSIRGTLTDAATGGLILDGFVYAYDASGNWVRFAPLECGSYEAIALPAGSYFVRTFNSEGYLDELYDDLPCSPNCTVTAGDPVAVTAGAAATADFALDKGGSISGTITDAATGAPIPDVGVDIYDAAGDYVGYGYTDATGAYSAGGLTTGTFFALAYEYSLGYLDELYNDIPCWKGCNVTDGDAIPVTLGADTPAINFALEQGSAIGGTVTDAATGAPITDGSVTVYDSVGDWVGRDRLDGSGVYEVTGFPAGSYFARTNNSAGYLDELWNDRLCEPWCDETAGDPIAVGAGATATADFALDKGGSISGTVVDAVTGSPIPDVEVDIYDSAGNYAGFGYTDATGAYTAGGLTTGTFHALAYEYQLGYLNELYDDIPCWNGCNENDGAPIPVVLGADTPGIDFALEKGGAIGGMVTDAATGAPITSGYVAVYDSAGDWVDSDWFDGSGAYEVTGFPSGSYFARTDNFAGYIDELWDDRLCEPDCTATAGDPIAVSAGATSPAHFALDKGGSISGTVTDAVTGSPIPDVEVDIYDSAGNYAGYGYTDATGAYSVGGLLTGMFHALTSDYSQGYLDELYDDIPCPLGDCDVTSGDQVPVTVGADTPGINFGLDKGGSISGSVVDAVSGAAVTSGFVSVYDSNGSWVGGDSLDGAGAYEVGGLPGGSYYVQTENWQGYLDELYDDIPCWSWCDVRTGDPVAVVQGVATPNIDFDLFKGGSIAGVVIDAVTGASITDARVRVYDSTGRSWGSDWADGSGAYEIDGLPPETYYPRVENESGYIDEYYDGVPVAGQPCGRFGTIGVPVALSEMVTGIDFTLERGALLAGNVFDAGTGAGIGDAEIEIFDAWGESVTYGYADATGAWVAEASLPDGTYYASSYNWAGYLDEQWDGLPCWPYCEATDGYPIVVASGLPVPPIDFALDKGGSIAGTVISEATGGPVGGYVYAFDAAGYLVASDRIDGAGAYEIEGLSTGTFYVRTSNWDGYLDELYDDLPCARGRCDETAGIGVPVTAGATTSGIDFVLGMGGAVSGTVTATAGSVPLADVTVSLYDALGTYVGYGYTDATGSYTATSLPPGTLHARTDGTPGYVDELYDDIPCPENCDETTGMGFTVNVGATTAGIDFALDPGGSISGVVTDAATGAPIDDASVYVYDGAGTLVAYGNADATGAYTAGGLPAGDFYARTSNWAGYADELWNNIPCTSILCDPTAGVPIAVTAGADTPGVVFSLDQGAVIYGSLTDQTTGVPLHDGRVYLYDSSGNQLSRRWVDDCGEYEFDELAAGSYLLHTENELGYLDEVYDNLPCAAGVCDFLSGDPVPGILGSSTQADFALDQRGRLEGRVLDHHSGAPIPNVCVDVWNASGAFAEQACTAANGVYQTTLSLAAGSYFASTQNALGYEDELFENLPCPGGVCDPTTGDPVLAGPGTVADAVDFYLAAECYVPGDLVLAYRAFDTVEVFEATGSIYVTAVAVYGAGHVTLRADGPIMIDNGFSTGGGSQLTIFNGPPLGGCP